MKLWRTRLVPLLFFANITATPATPQLLDNTAVIVNKGVILESEIRAFMRMIKLDIGQAEQSLPDDTTLYQQVREHLIMESIQLQIAAQMGLQLLDNELEQDIARIAQRQQLSSEQLRQQLISRGIDYAQYRERLRRAMLVNKLQQVHARINIMPQEVEALVKKITQQSQQETEFELRHILLSLPENPTAQQLEKTKNLAQQLITQLQQGADFSRLAISHSANAQALKGGKLGWAKLEELPTLFAEKLQGAHKGSLIGPFRTSIGFHILRIDDLRDPWHQSVLEIHARHILLKPSVVMSDQQAQAKLQQLAQQIRQKRKTFEQLARQYSQDTRSAAKGGDLGWANPAVHPPEFAAALVNLPPNQLSQPVRSAAGWHLIERLGTQRSKSSEAAQKEQAMRMLFNRKLAEESQNWLQKQRAAAYVKVITQKDYLSP